ncbi:putative DNA primase/helicase [Gammaproteobacteria bacterium]
MLDFNDIPVEHPRKNDRMDLRDRLLANLETLCVRLFPLGRKRLGKFVVGNLSGAPGDSLEIVLEGPKTGLWMDRAENLGGDVFDLIGGYYGLSARSDFPRILEKSRELLGYSGPSSATPETPKKIQRRDSPVDSLGPITAQWEYRDAAGKLLAVVYRHDPPGGKKTFRPWDAQRRVSSPPNPRPLYNQQGMIHSEQVILVEGEKCAQALIDAGFCATTAMHGANAPVNKTDWSPLAGKSVLVWPDKDDPGWAYAENAARAALASGAVSCAILMPPENQPEGWDAADALAEARQDRGDTDPPPFDVTGFILSGQRIPVEAAIEEAPPPDLLAGLDWSTEDGMATAFTRRYGEDWRYCALWGKWLVWTGVRWNADQVLYVSHLVRGICRAASLRAETHRLKAKLASTSSISAVEKLARSDPQHAARVEEWDANPWVLNTPAGVIDLRSGQLQGHRRQYRVTKVTAASPQDPCPLWLAFLTDITSGDTELMAYLQRMAGYCLTGATQEHALFFLYGTGGNGKSVFVNILFTLLGDYAANAPMETFMETRTERHPTDLAGLRGARLVTATETEQGRRWNEAKIKEITGGDRVTARFMRQDYFTYEPQFKLVISGNHKPSIRNVDEAMKRRLHLVPFTVTIPKPRRDPRLQARLLTERDGILAWALAGCLAWQRGGLQPPEPVLQATAEYFESEDAIGRWLEERCVLAPNATSLSAALFGDWKSWTEANGEFAGSQRRFSDLLLNKDLQKWRNALRERGFRGIRLKEAPPPSRT